MHRSLLLGLLAVTAACGPSTASTTCSEDCTSEARQAVANCNQEPLPPACLDPDSPPDDPPPPPPPASAAPVSFNGGFEARDFPYTGSCTCTDTDGNPSTPSVISCSPVMTNGACYCANHDNNTSTPDVVQCAAPIDLPYGWTVNPSDVFRGTRGNGGVFFLYGMGRNPGAPRPPGYVVPDGTALYFQTCDNSDRVNNTTWLSPPDGLPDSDWCFRTTSIVVSSSSFNPTPGATYRLSGWFYSTLFLSVGTVHENQLQLRARFFNASGAEVGSGTVQAPNAAPVDRWTEIAGMVSVPATATTGVVDVVVGRNHQSNVYVDDLALTAP